MLAGWTEPRLDDCGDRCATAAAGTADVADAADAWVVRRVDAKLFWRFLLIFFISIELMSKIVSCSMQI